MEQEKLVDIIVAARKELGMNQAEASLHCGFSETYLGMIERKRRLPGPRALLRIMTRLGIKEEVMREFLPSEFHNLYEASEPEYPRIREYLLAHAPSEELKKELLGASFTSVEGFICEFLFHYWSNALEDGLLPPEDWRHRTVKSMIDEVKNAGNGSPFKRMLEIFEEEELGPDGRPFSLLSLLKEWYYNKETNEVILKVSFDDFPGKERVYRLKPGSEGEGRPREAAWNTMEQVRRLTLQKGSFYELPAGLRELIYDQETFHSFQVREEELEYLKTVELRGTGGQPTKEGYLLELQRLRSREGASTEDALLLSKGANPRLLEILSKIVKADEKVQERIIKAIEPAVDAIIEASS